MANTKSKVSESNNLKIVFYALGLLGVLGTWGRAAADGSLTHLFHALHGANAYILPGTKETLRTSFTGIYWPIDYFLDVLVVFFWEALDGSHPTASVLGIYFLAQLFPIIVTMYMDHCRVGHGSGSSLIRPTLWLLSTQMCAIACTGFLWALDYTSSTPTISGSLSLNELRKASVLSPRMTLLILPGVILGYVVPAIAMALPSPIIVTNNFQQLAVVAWNLYPLIIFPILKALGSLVQLISGRRNDQPASSPKQHLRTVRIVNCTSLLLSTTIHISISALSISTILFPFLFNPKYADYLHPASLLLPPVSVIRGNTVGDGVRSFFMWDQIFGYPVVTLVMVLQLHTAVAAIGHEVSWLKTAGITGVVTCVAGPGSAALALSWLRDEVLFGGEVGDAGKGK